jgi:hypothetical protein
MGRLNELNRYLVKSLNWGEVATFDLETVPVICDLEQKWFARDQQIRSAAAAGMARLRRPYPIVAEDAATRQRCSAGENRK